MSGLVLMKNVGRGVWRHPSSGEVIQPNGVFYATEVQIERMKRRGQYGKRFLPVTDEEVFDEQEEGAGEGEDEGEGGENGDTGGEGGGDGEGEGEGATGGGEEEWPIRMTPGTYLSLHPEGQYADLARRLVSKEE